MIDLDRQAFRGAREALETIGAPGSGPDRLSRDELLRLVAVVGDLSLFSAEALRPWDQWAPNSPAVLGRFSFIYLVSREGFYVHSVINRSGPQVTFSFTDTPAALANLVAATPQSVTGVPSTISCTVGDAAAGIPLVYNLTGTQVYQPVRPLWVPPGRTLQLNCNVANTAVSACLETSQPLN